LGNPISNTTSVGNGITQQEFENGAIVGSDRGIFPIDEPIWTEIVKRGGINGSLGIPVESAEDLGNGNSSQTFKNGLLVVSGGITYVIASSPILDTYVAEGAAKGLLGLPTSNVVNESTGFLKQEFESGYIVWNSDKAVAYDRRAQVKISDRDKKGFKPLEQILRDYQVEDDIVIIIEKNKLTGKEISLLSEKRSQEARFKEISNLTDGIVITEARRQFPEGAANGHQDAFRHSYWNILLSKEFGIDWAKKFTTAHEGSSDPKPLDDVAEAMDLYNNEVGRKIYSDNFGKSDAELSELLKQDINNGKLLVIHSDQSLAWSDQVIPGQTATPTY
jgi:hypothetical protein